MAPRFPMTAAMARLANGVVVVAPGGDAHGPLVRELGARAVAVDRVVGRDLLEADRVVVPEWRLFGRMPHVKELLQRRRGHTIALVGFAGEPVDGDGTGALLRFAGRVFVADGRDPEPLAARLCVPVDAVGRAGLGAAIAAAAAMPAADLDDVGHLLREAMAFSRRGDDEGAFVMAARALGQAPDQPGVVADVARLLARMGRAGEATRVCRSYLLQRPDSGAVQQALAEVAALAR